MPRTTPFAGLKAQPPDPLLSLIKLFRDDPRSHKIDLGVGVYRDETGATPVLRAVKAAELQLLETQSSKSYLGPEGDVGFAERLMKMVFGASGSGATALFGMQTPGGTGAVRLAAEFLKRARPDARLWVGRPTWPNHDAILNGVGVQLESYRHFDPATQGASVSKK